MSRMFGFMANEPDRLRCALYPVRRALAAPTDPDGWGVGFYQGGEVLLTKRPKPPQGGLDVYAVLRELRTDVLLGHVRTYVSATPPGAASDLGAHPYRFRQWLFAHNGVLEKFEEIREDMLDTIPDFLRRNIRGTSDGEHLFHLLLAFLHDGGRLDDPNVAPAAARDSLRSMATFVDKLVAGAGGRAPADLSMLATNGRIMVALRRGRPMVVRRQSGVYDCTICREPSAELGRETKRVSHELLRSVLIVSEPANLPSGEGRRDGTSPGVGDGFEEVPDGGTVAVSHELSLDISGGTAT